MKALGWIAGVVTLVAAGVYTAVSLARWEWNRALFFGMVFVAAELGLVAAALLRKLTIAVRELERGGRGTPSPATLDAIRRGREGHDRFPWLRIDPMESISRTNVFVTLVVGGGVLVSAAAWLIDRLASRTVDPVRESRLGRELSTIEYRDGLVVDAVEALARPRPHRDDPRVHSFLGGGR